ncbi:hypothetical protein ACWGJA_22320, partial [Streptomyces sp. NPDC054784]
MRTRAAVACSVADQGVSALTNIAVLVVAARQSTAAGFAAFSVVYTVFTVLLGLSVGYVGQALVLERGPAHVVRAACRAAVAFTALASTAVAAVCGVALWAATGFEGRLAAGLGALALVLPVVLTHDCLRYAFSALQRPHHALAADVLRLAGAVAALGAQPRGAGADRMIAVWGASALPALLLGLVLLLRAGRGGGADGAAEPTGAGAGAGAVTGPVPVAVRPGVRRYLGRGHLGVRFALEFAVGNAGTQLAVIALGLWANPLAVGALRGATTLFGPMNVLFNAATGFGPPLLRRAGGPRRSA